MIDELNSLIVKASQTEMTPEQFREQRQSFVYGNTNIENSVITRNMVIEADLKSLLTKDSLETERKVEE